MATAVFCMMTRHLEPMIRAEYQDPVKEVQAEIAAEVFEKMKWRHDVFAAEYLTKKTEPQREYEEVIQTLSILRLPKHVLRDTGITTREYVRIAESLQKKDVPHFMRTYWKYKQRK